MTESDLQTLRHRVEKDRQTETEKEEQTYKQTDRQIETEKQKEKSLIRTQRKQIPGRTCFITKLPVLFHLCA